VYRWGKHAVVKVLRPDIPDEWAIREARTTELVHAAGIPAPAVLEVITIGGRPGIVFERAAGVSMWEQMLARPADTPRLASLLVELQAEVNATPAPAGLPNLVDRLRANIERTRHLSSLERQTALRALDRSPQGDALCHFDIHPNNVLMGPKGPKMIDWFDAAAGDPTADVTRSSVLMRFDAADGHLPCPEPSFVELLHDRYIARVVQMRSVDQKRLLAWEPPILAARLAEPIGGAVREATRRMWRAAIASQRTRLGTCLRSLSADRVAAAQGATTPWRIDEDTARTGDGR
jgi:aminoglycoside phosphotransferase (APT) family kinase protein